MFYIAYTVPSANGRPRPVTFLFNGGPGSSTMWLHMGSFGPMKVDASMPEMDRPARRSAMAPTPTRCSTSATWSSSTPRPPACRARSARPRPKDFFGVDKDLDAFTRDDPALSDQIRPLEQPKFIIGESYGTLRAAGLSQSLADKGVQLNGIALVSTVLNFGQLFAVRPDLRQLPADLRGRRLVSRPRSADKPTLDELPAATPAHFAARPLRRGASAGRQRSAPRRSSPSRPTDGAFHRPLARLICSPTICASTPTGSAASCCATDATIIGRIDSRFIGTEPDPPATGADYDPQASAISGALIGDDQRLSVPRPRLQNAADLPPEQLRRSSATTGTSSTSARWRTQLAADTSVDLAAAMRENPRLKFLSVNGLYDLATPFFGRRI